MIVNKFNCVPCGRVTELGKYLLSEFMRILSGGTGVEEIGPKVTNHRFEFVFLLLPLSPFG